MMTGVYHRKVYVSATSPILGSDYNDYHVDTNGNAPPTWAVDGSNNVTGLVGPDGTRVGVAIKLAQSAVAVPLTGTTNATVLASLTIAAGAMGINSALRVSAMYSMTNNANNKTLAIRHGGSATYYSAALANLATVNLQFLIMNRGATGSQIGFPSNLQNSFTGSAAPFVTGSVDTASANVLEFIGTLANAGDTITLEGYVVELLP